MPVLVSDTSDAVGAANSSTAPSAVQVAWTDEVPDMWPRRDNSAAGGYGRTGRREASTATGDGRHR